MQINRQLQALVATTRCYLQSIWAISYPIFCRAMGPVAPSLYFRCRHGWNGTRGMWVLKPSAMWNSREELFSDGWLRAQQTWPTEEDHVTWHGAWVTYRQSQAQVVIPARKKGQIVAHPQKTKMKLGLTSSNWITTASYAVRLVELSACLQNIHSATSNMCNMQE